MQDMADTAAEALCLSQEEVNTQLGAVCTFKCDKGYAPEKPAPVTCDAVTGVWSATLSNCTDCAVGYYKSGSACMLCSSSLACPIGQYRGACSDSADAICLPCTGKPPGAYYTSPGRSPVTTDNCEWKCEGLGMTSFLSGGQCLPCSTTLCPAGQYRGSCDLSQGAQCKPCTNPGPPNSEYAGPGVPFDQNSCAITCASGFYDTGNGACSADLSFNVVVGSRVLSTSETPGTPASFDLVLTRVPASDVVVTCSTGTQLSPLVTTVTFTTANWNTPVVVQYSAVDDSMVEGLHGGVVHMVVSSTDKNYHRISVEDVTIGIADNDCAPISRPQFGNLSSPCNGAAGGKCTVTCDPGHAPAAPVVLTCTPGTLVWDKNAPGCNMCLTGYYKDSLGRCRKCTSAQCPAGEYREACTADMDGTCQACANVPPANAIYTSASSTGNLGCQWGCQSGEACLLLYEFIFSHC